jgi:hypothetical protein
MAIKERMSTDHDHAIIAEATRGEHSALGIYAEALSGLLPPDALEIIEAQQATIKASLEKLSRLTTMAA